MNPSQDLLFLRKIRHKNSELQPENEEQISREIYTNLYLSILIPVVLFIE